jgi:hypothetical protein
MLCPEPVALAMMQMGLGYKKREPIFAVGTGPPVEGLKEFSAPGIKLWEGKEP